jgi:hypothetical protein
MRLAGLCLGPDGGRFFGRGLCLQSVVFAGFCFEFDCRSLFDGGLGCQDALFAGFSLGRECRSFFFDGRLCCQNMLPAGFGFSGERRTLFDLRSRCDFRRGLGTDLCKMRAFARCAPSHRHRRWHTSRTNGSH